MKQIIKDLLTVLFGVENDISKEVTAEEVYSEFATTCSTIDF